jgi:hypothetical protein
MAARLFNLMLCALLLGLSSPAAKAITRPENRVGGSARFSSVFAAQESANPIGTRAENPGCGYDFVSGVHKYLYAEANPVNEIDPSGHDEMLDVLAAISISAFVESFNTISVGALSWAKGSLPDAYIIGGYISLGVQQNSTFGTFNYSAIGGLYYVYHPKEKERALYWWWGGEGAGNPDLTFVKGNPDPITGLRGHGEIGGFEMWDWGFPGFQSESFSFFKPLLAGGDFGGSLYGAEWNGAGEQAVLFGRSSSDDISLFGVKEVKTGLISTEFETATDMATQVAVEHTAVSALETANIPVNFNVIGEVLGGGINAGAAAYWVNHKYGN